MIQNLQVQVTFRSTSNNKPYIVMAYDSRVDKFSKIKKYFSGLGPSGTTPEGLCFEAIQKEFLQSNNDIDSFTSTWVLFAEDDDGNENSPEGLYFYLDDVEMNNQLVAVVSSYDPYVVGTVDFTVTSDKALSIIPEPLAFSLIGVGGISLLILRRKLS